ncbi:MAG TPA: methyltransferase [Xanthomonadales bacterium]|nr:methyltransferase [Xanthomonadales bacterium]
MNTFHGPYNVRSGHTNLNDTVKEDALMNKSFALLATLVFTSSLSAQQTDSQRLAQILQAQPAETQARYAYRHPQETLEFFGIVPEMNVVEALPDEGWYTKILLPYVGPDGALIGADYAPDMYAKFAWASPEFLEAKKTWVATWTTEATTWRTDDSAAVSAFVFGSLPDAVKGTADAVLFIRALHNLQRFESQGGYLTAALQNAFDALKPGGIVGVVQHQAPEGSSAEFVDGSHGYLKKSQVIEFMQVVGFEFVAESAINENPKDQPGPDDIVWRLPPSLGTSKDNPELAAQMKAIGESNRMTLKFRKPGGM